MHVAIQIAAERGKDTNDIARLLRKPNVTNANDAGDLAYNKYGDHSVRLEPATELTHLRAPASKR